MFIGQVARCSHRDLESGQDRPGRSGQRRRRWAGARAHRDLRPAGGSRGDLAAGALSRTPFKEYLALRWTTWQNVVIGIAAMIVVVVGWDLLSKATGHEVTAGFMGDILKSATADGVLWLVVLAFAVVAPLRRNCWRGASSIAGGRRAFCGCPARSSCRRWSGPRCTCNTTVFPRRGFFDRIVLGYIRYRSQSIWLTTLLHGLNNLAALIQTIVMTHS